MNVEHTGMRLLLLCSRIGTRCHVTTKKIPSIGTTFGVAFHPTNVPIQGLRRTDVMLTLASSLLWTVKEPTGGTAAYLTLSLDAAWTYIPCFLQCTCGLRPIPLCFRRESDSMEQYQSLRIPKPLDVHGRCSHVKA